MHDFTKHVHANHSRIFSIIILKLGWVKAINLSSIAAVGGFVSLVILSIYFCDIHGHLSRPWKYSRINYPRSAYIFSIGKISLIKVLSATIKQRHHLVSFLLQHRNANERYSMLTISLMDVQLYKTLQHIAILAADGCYRYRTLEQKL